MAGEVVVGGGAGSGLGPGVGPGVGAVAEPRADVSAAYGDRAKTSGDASGDRAKAGRIERAGVNAGYGAGSQSPQADDFAARMRALTERNQAFSKMESASASAGTSGNSSSGTGASGNGHVRDHTAADRRNGITDPADADDPDAALDDRAWNRKKMPGVAALLEEARELLADMGPFKMIYASEGEYEVGQAYDEVARDEFRPGKGLEVPVVTGRPRFVGARARRKKT